jgi:Domain of unknown function (DUF4271)
MIKDFIIKDTIKQKLPARQDMIKQLSDSSQHINDLKTDSVLHSKAINFQLISKTENTDTASFCHRNRIADITFYDSTNIITKIDESRIQNFPFVFTAINRKKQEETNADLVKHLKNGNELSSHLFHYDWVLPVIIFSAFIYGIIKAELRKYFQGILKFISFHGINENASRDIGALFQWQSTLFNLASFINISLFAFFTSLWYNVVPFEGKKFFYWLIILAIIIFILTVRHFVCIIIGNMSSEKELFREYLICIYRTYRLAGLFLLFLTVLILYTTFIPVNILFYTGFSLVALAYFVRALRLFLIFINRHVSIFYLILYLCALEILPVVIIVKYATGLI